MDLGPHAAFIWAAYAAAVMVLGVLALWLVLDGRRQQRLLETLDARGMRRRSNIARSSPE